MKVIVRGHGVLRAAVLPGPRDVPEGIRVVDLLALLGYEEGGVWMIVVNGQDATRDRVLMVGDEVELVPPLGGG